MAAGENRIGAHFYIVFSELVKDREQAMEMMIDKLSYDNRVDEWGYETSAEKFRAVGFEVDNAS